MLGDLIGVRHPVLLRTVGVALPVGTLQLPEILQHLFVVYRLVNLLHRKQSANPLGKADHAVLVFLQPPRHGLVLVLQEGDFIGELLNLDIFQEDLFVVPLNDFELFPGEALYGLLQIVHENN